MVFTIKYEISVDIYSKVFSIRLCLMFDLSTFHYELLSCLSVFFVLSNDTTIPQLSNLILSYLGDSSVGGLDLTRMDKWTGELVNEKQ